jgi:hypothetical protein
VKDLFEKNYHQSRQRTYRGCIVVRFLDAKRLVCQINTHYSRHSGNLKMCGPSTQELGPQDRENYTARMGATRIPIPIAAPAELLCAPSPIIAQISPENVGGRAKPARSGRASAI